MECKLLPLTVFIVTVFTATTPTFIAIFLSKIANNLSVAIHNPDSRAFKYSLMFVVAIVFIFNFIYIEAQAASASKFAAKEIAAAVGLGAVVSPLLFEYAVHPVVDAIIHPPMKGAVTTYEMGDHIVKCENSAARYSSLRGWSARSSAHNCMAYDKVLKKYVPNNVAASQMYGRPEKSQCDFRSLKTWT